MAASLAFMVTVIAELIAHSNQEPPLFALSLLAGLFAVAALATGGYAQVVQLTRWSRRVHNRLLIGVPGGLLMLILAAVNMYKQQAPVSRTNTPSLVASRNPYLADEDHSLFKPGWYGEGQSNGVQVVVTSFEGERRRVTRLQPEHQRAGHLCPLTIINLGNPQPVTLARTRVTLLLESGEEVQSMDVKPLLRLSAMDSQMRQRLAEPRVIAPGMMAADIPICLNSQFRWERARAVKVSFQTGDLLIAGRVLTADEKRNLTEQPPKPQNTVTNLSAEDWFKEM